MIIAAVVVAVVLAVYVVKYLPLNKRWILSVVLLLITVLLGSKIYDGIMMPINFDIEKKARYEKVIKQLKIIRDAEVAHYEVTGAYSKDKAGLIQFIDSAQFAITETKNVEVKVDRGGGISIMVSKRQVDTIGYEPVAGKFVGKDYKNMFSVPGTDKEFSIAIGTIEKIAGLFVPVFEVKVDKVSVLAGMDNSLVKQEVEAKSTDQIKGEFVKVGSLDEVTTGGNWPPYYDKADGAKKDHK